MRKLLISILICGLSVGFSTTYGAEVVAVDASTRNVINTGTISFAPGQLQISGVVIGPGGSGTGTINAISLQLPTLLFNSPVTFTVDSTGTAIGVSTLALAPSLSAFANLNGSDAVPTWASLTDIKTAMGLGNLDNTSDANKPISTATQTALDLKINTTAVDTALALKADVTYVDDSIANFAGSSSLTTLGTVTTGVWNGTALTNAYLPVLNSITAPTGSLSLASNKIINLADPTNATDATNKQYVDSVANAGPPHGAVVAATTGNGTLASAYEDADTVDGVTLATGDRILLKDQTSGSENGIYTVNASGAPTRATDADTGAEVSGTVFVSGGTANAGTTWGVTTPQPITINTTAVAYTQTGANTVYTAGTGLSLVGSQFKLANLSAPSKILGRYSAGAGVPQELTISTGLSLDGSGNLTATGGSVTNFSAGTLSPLFTTSVATSTSTPALTFSLSTAAANTFFGNGTGSTAAPTFMNAATARTALGGTTAGQSIFTITNPSAITFPRIEANNTATTRTPAQVLTDIGAESVLTFVAPLSRSTNAISMSIAGAAPGANGYLQATDFVKFQAGYAASPQTVLASTCTGTSPCILTINTTANPRINQVLLDSVLSNPLRIVIPPAANYGAAWAYEPIEILDIVGGTAQTNNGVTVRRSSSDTIDGSASDLTLPRGVTYSRLTPNGVASWTSTYYYVNSVKDPVDATKEFRFSAAAQASGTPGIVTPPAGLSVTLLPTDSNAAGMVRDINADGTATKNEINPAELLPVEYSIGTTGNSISATSFDVTNSAPFPDIVRIRGDMSGPITVNWPYADASHYGSGKRLTVIDASGTVGPNHPVTITSAKTTPDTFSGQGSYLLDEAFGQRTFVSDGSGGWSVPVAKVSVLAFTPTGGPNLNVSGSSVAVKHNAHFTLTSGVNTLTVTSAYDGMDMDLFLAQPSSGSAATLNLPSVSRVGASGGGLVTLSSTNGRIDRLRGSYNAAANAFMWDPPILDYSKVLPPSAPSGLSLSVVNSFRIDLSWTDNATTETGYEVYRAAGQSATTGFNLIAGASSLPAGSTSYADNGLEANHYYTYKVRAINSGGGSSYSSPATDTTPLGGAVAEIWQVLLNEGATNSSALTTTTTTPVGGTATLSYPSWVTISSGNSAFNALAGMLNTTGSCSSLPCITNGGTPGAITYKYRVFAYKNNGRHNGTTDRTTATGAAILNSTDYNQLTWNAVTGADYYQVYRSSATGGNPSSTGLISGNITGAGPFTFQDTGLTATGSVPALTSTDAYTVTADNNVTYGVNKVTISMWVKSTWGGTTSVISLGGLNTTVTQLAGKLSVTMNGGTTGTLSGNTPVNVNPGGLGVVNSGNELHHVVAILDNSTPGNTMTPPPGVGATDNIRVYLDGVQEPITWASTNRSGAGTWPAAKPVLGSSNFTGAIDDVRLFNRELSGGEITTLKNDGPQ